MPPSKSSSHGFLRSGSSRVENPSTGKRSPSKLGYSVASSTKLSEIQDALPSSTDAERRRFLADRNGDINAAISKLRNYLEWRKQYGDDELSHLDSWTYATQLASRSAPSGGKGGSSKDMSTLKLPCTLFTVEHEQSTPKINTAGETAIITRKYLQLLPARIDTKLADTSIYALALALYIDHNLDRSSTEKATLVIDVRAGHGWANIKAIHLLPFIQSTIKLLSELHPMRLEQCIIFPLPGVANVLWKTIKPFLGKDTAGKVCLVSGPAGKNDKVPKKMRECLGEDLITKFEERRISCFTR